jgi:sulfur-oxidizing protein SoxY
MGLSAKVFGNLPVFIASCTLAWIACLQVARADNEATARIARWTQVQRAVFADRQVLDGTSVLQLEAPQRALDPALVPLTITLKEAAIGGKPVKGVYVVIDNNPAPLAGHFVFGPAADPRVLKMRVRVDQYTDIHAVAEGADGKLYAVAKFVKASGGCSAPAGSEEVRDLGRMKLHLIDAFAAGKPMQAQLMIRHPNFNGMQMDQLTRYYTPAHFIRTIDVNYGGGQVLHIDSDISLSTDPVIGFGFVPRAKGQLKIAVLDSKDQRFERSFEVPVEADGG